MSYNINNKGYYGEFGGAFIPEMLYPNVEELRKKYIAGNFGYGHAKKELLELILDKYSEERKSFDGLMADLGELENQLAKGEEKARIIANEVLDRTRKKLGY